MAQQSHFVSKHVYTCFANRHLVFLDLRRDKYLCLDQATSSAVGEILQGSAATSVVGTGDGAALQPNTDDVLATLASQQLITEDEHHGKRAASAFIAAPAEALLPAADAPIPTLKLRHVARFFVAAVNAAVRLRWVPIERTVERTRQRKLACTEHYRTTALDRMKELTATFGALRPFFPRNYLCLFDSLALVEYLAKFDIFPTWVFGVRMDPFGAHCWLQEGSVVVNDTVENVRDYTPIMTV